ncbi:MAG TPA: hypothetical protein DIC34_05680 [Treponema sp.]|nr:hypothetical protein [Treponema sp.]
MHPITVVCADTDRKKIRNLLDGCISIFEPGLDYMVLRTVEAGRLSLLGRLNS